MKFLFINGIVCPPLTKEEGNSSAEKCAVLADTHSSGESTEKWFRCLLPVTSSCRLELPNFWQLKEAELKREQDRLTIPPPNIQSGLALINSRYRYLFNMRQFEAFSFYSGSICSTVLVTDPKTP
jgi:hypothetical protein